MTPEQPTAETPPTEPPAAPAPVEPPPAPPAPAPRTPFDWSALARSLMLIVPEGFSFGLYCWMGTHLGLMQGYIEGNRLPAHIRSTLLLIGAVCAVGWTTFACWFYWIAKGGSLQKLERVARRASPVLIAVALPMLFNYRLWPGRELTFLVLVVVTCFGLERAVMASLEAGPCLLPARLANWVSLKWTAVRTRVANAKDAPLYVVVAAASGYAAYFTAYALRGHYRFDTAAFDLGIENNLVWNAVHWGPLFKTSPLGGPTATHLGFHQTYFAYLLGIPYRLWPTPQMMLMMQSAFIGAAALPLFLWSKARVGAWVACAIAVAYLFYPPLHGANLYDFHYQPLAPFFCWFTLYFIDRGKWLMTALFVLMALSLREDISAMLAIFGLYLVLANHRAKAGLVLMVVGAIYFVGLKLIIMPRFLDGVDAYIHQYAGLVPAGDKGFKAVLKTVFANPGYTLTTLLEKDKLVYVLLIFAPLAFLPLRRPMGLLFAIPGFFFTLLATGYPPLVQTSFQYTIYWALFLFPACAHVLANPTLLPRRTAILAAFALAVMANTYQQGAIIQRETIRGGFQQYRWGITDADHQRHADAYELMKQIPPLAKVATTERLNPHLSSRPDAYTLRWTVHDAEFVLYEHGALRSDEINVVRSAVSGKEFGLVAEKGNFVLLKRGADPARNPELLSRLR